MTSATVTAGAPYLGQDTTHLRLLPFLRRRLWIVIVAAVVAGIIALGIAAGAKKLYSATGYLVVPTNGNTLLGQPGTAATAEGLAETYATLLPQDPAFTAALYARSPQTRADADAVSNFTVTNLGRTSVLKVTTKAPNAAAVNRFFTDLAAEVGQPKPASANIVAGTLRVLRQPGGASVATNYRKEAPILGVVLGAVLGIVIGLVLERARPRLDDPQDARDALGLPAFAVRRETVAASVALGARPDAPARSGRGKELAEVSVVVAVVAVGRGGRRAAREAAAELRRTLVEDDRVGGTRLAEAITVVITADPRSSIIAVRQAQVAQEVWLAAPTGALLTEVKATLQHLESCGIGPDRLALTRRRRVWGGSSEPEVQQAEPAQATNVVTAGPPATAGSVRALQDLRKPRPASRTATVEHEPPAEQAAEPAPKAKAEPVKVEPTKPTPPPMAPPAPPVGEPTAPPSGDPVVDGLTPAAPGRTGSRKR